MLESKTCAVVIPCFNENASIKALVFGVRRHIPAVIVVDDGSSDDTSTLAKVAGATVIRHERNLGKGAALKTGLSLASQLGYEWAFTLDGDGQHDPDDFPAFLQCARQSIARLIIGNRMSNARAIPWLRRQVNRWMSPRLSRRAGHRLPDTQCGFRLIHLGAWPRYHFQTDRSEVE